MRKIMNQQGIVSIVVSVIIMIILTLIAIGFAQIMRREQRQALDRQLSSQAYYAAESAINDAAYALSVDPESIANNPGSCATGSGPLTENEIDSELGIEYSCVTIDSTPTVLRYDAIKVDETIQVELRAIDGTGSAQQLEDLVISWRDKDGNGLARTAGAGILDLPIVSGWGDQPGIIRLEIVPINNVAGSDTRADLVSARKVFWLYPTDGTGTGNTSWGLPSGSVVRGDCGTALDATCTVTIQNIVSPDNNMSYIVRMRAVYDDVETTINGVLTNGSDAYFRGAQTQIDATGRAQDVLRRISARIAIEQVYPTPDYLHQSFGGICKDMELVSASNVVYNCP